jgi:hypothetical protein
VIWAVAAITTIPTVTLCLVVWAILHRACEEYDSS